MKYRKNYYYKRISTCRMSHFLPILVLINFIGCTKLVNVPQPINTITATQTFSTDGTATAAVLAIYSEMSYHKGSVAFANGGSTFYGGLSSDELSDHSGLSDPFLSNTLIAGNTLTSGNTTPYSIFWQPAYYDIYMANAVILGLQASTSVTAATKNQLIGEAKFLRALCYFYLTNFYGDVPLVLSNDFNQTALMARTPQKLVYQQIIADLQEAQSLLINDYSLSNSEHIRANKSAAMALLARTYLYTQDWGGADSSASAVINSGNYSLLSTLDSVFKKNNSESILQLQTISTAGRYVTFEARNFIPANSKTTNSYYLSSQLMGAFEPGDQRRISWVDSSIVRGVTYYYPYKYKIPLAQGNSQNITEYYTVLRYAEQYLIRAEARAQEGSNLTGAINDLNSIRNRAGLDSLSNYLTKDQVLAAVVQERRIELFAEWGHRWLDLKRWGTAVATLDTIPVKQGHINTYQLLYPIDLSELQTNPNLTQNPGY